MTAHTSLTARFGTAGNPDAFLAQGGKHSKQMPAWLKAQGLDAYEYQCGKGVTLGEATAREIGKQAEEAGIALSLHAPYFVNPANPDPASQEKTAGYVLAACRAAQWMGADRVVIHTGALQKRSREEALATAKESFRMLRRRCDDEGYGTILLCPETMGKINQLGDLEEVLTLCTVAEGLLPCVDFGHLYARSLGALEGEEATAAMLDRMAAVLGEEKAARFHSHFSQIEFTPKGGEARHLTFAQSDFGPDPGPLCRQIAARGWHPTVICESAGTQAEDALMMKTLYTQALGR
jgi:deoxyribonuclease-4